MVSSMKGFMWISIISLILDMNQSCYTNIELMQNLNNTRWPTGAHTHTHNGDSTGYGINWQDYYRFNQGPCHAAALPFTLKSIFMQKKNYGNSNISPCKDIIFKKSAKRNQNPSRYYNSITDLKFQPRAKIIIFPKSSYKNRAIIIT